MSGWADAELAAVETEDEIRVASHRPDGSLRPFVIIWAVRVGDDVFVRAAYGPDTGWYRRARHSGTGAVRVAGIERPVAFVEADAALSEAVDAAYHAKYDRYGPKLVGTVTGPAVHGLTLRVDPDPAGA